MQRRPSHTASIIHDRTIYYLGVSDRRESTVSREKSSASVGYASAHASYLRGHVEVADIWGWRLGGGWVGLQSVCSLLEAGAHGLQSLRAWVHDARARARRHACSVDGAAVLGGVADERQRLGPALDLRRDGAHALSGGRANTAAVVPGVAVAWRLAWLVGVGGGGELGVAVDLALV